MILLFANALVLITFIAHTFGGDREYRRIEPSTATDKARYDWLMGRGAFHIVSADFLLATIGLSLVNFTDFFRDEKLILSLLALYFLLYGLGFLIALVISKSPSNRFLKLPQWILLWAIAGLIYIGM